jgi:hydrogenase maturation protease
VHGTMPGDRAAATVVVALGNPLMGDDGVGLAALTLLRTDWTFAPPVRFVDGGSSGLNLLPTLRDARRALLVDAIDIGLAPGTLVALERADLPRLGATARTAHEVSLRDVFALAELTGAMPEIIVAIGLQPACLALRPSLSPPVAAAVAGLVRAIIARLAIWGHGARPVDRRAECACTS